MKAFYWLFVLCTLIFFFPSFSDAEIISADGVLSQISSWESSAVSSESKELKSTQIQDIKKDLEEFQKKRFDLSPEKAAETWLSLFNRYFDLSEKEKIDAEQGAKVANRLSQMDFFFAFPGAQAWSILEERIEKTTELKETLSRSEVFLRVLIFFLNGKEAKLEKELSLLPTKINFGKDSGRSGYDIAFGIRSSLKKSKDKKKKETIIELERFLDSLSKDSGFKILIPDLVSMAGEEHAQRFLKKVFEKGNVEISGCIGSETRKLLYKEVLENISKLQKPQWALVNSIDCADLFEAMYKRFPIGSDSESIVSEYSSLNYNNSEDFQYSSQENTYSREGAQAFYLLGLIEKGQEEKAVDLVNSPAFVPLGTNAFFRALNSTESRISNEKLFSFLKNSIKSKNSQLSPAFKEIGFSIGKEKEVIQFFAEKKSDPAVSTSQKLGAIENYIASLLADNEIELGVEEIRQVFLATDTKIFDSDRMGSKKIAFATQMVKIGISINKPELVREGLFILQKIMDQEDSFYMGHFFAAGSKKSLNLAELLLSKGFYEEMQQMVLLSIKKQLKLINARNQPMGSIPLDEQLKQLARIYCKKGLYKDVLFLFEKIPYWSGKDILTFSDPAIVAILAEALIAEKRETEALKLLKYGLWLDSSLDRLYEPFLKIGGEEVIPFLDKLFSCDHFEERPLIWKAKYLLDQGMLDDAEKTIRDALKIDPTDGEQPFGDRVRGYSILGSILEAKGKKDDAIFFQNVVKSVRVAEEGDLLTAAGLTKMSLDKYREAEILFKDAYCIQWRMAERLFAMGNVEEAEKHYEIAFERMPEQFGEMASLCFGCEGIFKNQRSRSVAERVLLRLTGLFPEKPQVFFLLGKLRSAQEKYEEAYVAFKKALELDPNYIDALKEVLSLRYSLKHLKNEMEPVMLKLLDMDPFQKHFSFDFQEVTDIKAFFEVLEKHQKLSYEIPKILFPLARQEKVQKVEELLGREDYELDYFYERGNITPGKLIGQNNTIQNLISILR